MSDPAPGLTIGVRALAYGGVPLFDNLRFRLDAGRWTCLLGPSGVGKTTLLRLIAGLAPGALVAADDGAGLERREFCLWVLPEPDDVENATRAVRGAIPDLDRHLAARDFEILDHSFWQHGDGSFDGKQISAAYAAKLTDALARGYAGMRVSAVLIA